MKKIFSKTQDIWWLILILLVSIIVRFYGLGRPIADWHSFRQSDTASVAYEYYLAGEVDWLRPQYQDLSNIQSGLDNVEGWRMVEAPIINGLVAHIMLLFGSENVVLIYRLVDIFFSLCAVAGLYWLTLKLSKNCWVARLTAFVLAVLPFGVYYSTSILPEVALLAGQVWALNFFYNYLESEKRWVKTSYWCLTLIILILSFLLKPVTVFLAPVFAYLSWMKYKNLVFKQWQLYILAVLAVLPLLMWRIWILNFPSGIPASEWLMQGQVKAFSGAWWRWLGWERMVKLIVGWWGMIVLILGLMKRSEKRGLTAFDGFVMTYMGSMILFLLVFASGNVQHDYYQVFILPALAIALGKGGVWLIKIIEWHKLKKITKIISVLSGLVGAVGLICLQIKTGILSEDQTGGVVIGIWCLVLGLIIICLILAENKNKFGRFVSQKKSSFTLWMEQKKAWQVLTSSLAVMILIGWIFNYLMLSWRIKGYYQINHPEIVMAGERFRELIKDEEATVIAPYQSDTAFLFQTRHRGWPIGGEIDEKILLGADYYLTVNNDDEKKELQKRFETVYEDEIMTILDLKKSLESKK